MCQRYLFSISVAYICLCIHIRGLLLRTISIVTATEVQFVFAFPQLQRAEGQCEVHQRQ